MAGKDSCLAGLVFCFREDACTLQTKVLAHLVAQVLSLRGAPCCDGDAQMRSELRGKAAQCAECPDTPGELEHFRASVQAPKGQLFRHPVDAHEASTDRECEECAEHRQPAVPPPGRAGGDDSPCGGEAEQGEYARDAE